MLNVNTVDRHIGISLQHVIIKKVLNQYISICINHVFHSQVRSIFCWDEKVDRKKRWVVQFLLHGPTLTFWSSWWLVNHNFKACCSHKKICIRTEVWEAAVISQANIWHEETFFYLLCAWKPLVKMKCQVIRVSVDTWWGQIMRWIHVLLSWFLTWYLVYYL